MAEVETSGDAFDALGRPRILFERHYFHRLTPGRYDVKHARMSKRFAAPAAASAAAAKKVHLKSKP